MGFMKKKKNNNNIGGHVYNSLSLPFLLDRTSPLLKKEEEDRSSNTN